MAMQLLVGVPLEMVHGALRIGLVYLCGVLAGGDAFFSVFYSQRDMPQNTQCFAHTIFPLPVQGFYASSIYAPSEMIFCGYYPMKNLYDEFGKDV